MLGTAFIFGGVTLFTMLTLLFWNLFKVGWTLSQLSPSVIWGTLWPPTFTAVLLGAALGGLFEKTARLRLGILYAALLGFLIAVPVVFLSQGLNALMFVLTFETFNEKDSGLRLVWLPGPLTGVFVWALLRRPHRRRV